MAKQIPNSRTYTCFCLFLLLFLAGSHTSYAETNKTYQLYLTYLPGFIESEKEGIGARLNREIIKRVEHNEQVRFKVHFFPPKRAISAFNQQQGDLVFATVLGDQTNDLEVSQGISSIDSAAVAGSGYIILTLKTKPKLSSIKELAGKRVGVIRGVTLPEEFESSSVKALEEVDTIKQSLQQLRYKRIDAVITIKPMAIPEIDKLRAYDIHFGKSFNITFASYSAHLTKEGARLIEYINKAIAEMLKDGTYEAILSESPETGLLK